VVSASEPDNQLVNTVHGAMETYDLPKRIRLAGGKTVPQERPVDATGKPLGQ
jgi:hypothetical protein